MKLYKPKERVEAEQQKGAFVALDENGEKHDFVTDDYLVKRDGLVFGMEQDKFEAKYEPSKAQKAKEASSTTSPRRFSRRASAQGQG